MKFSNSQKGRIPSALVAYLMSAAPPSLFSRKRPRSYEDILETLVSVAPELEVPERLLQPKDSYRVNHVKTGQDFLQHLMKIKCRLPNGRVRKLKMLVDTGAQANLIREGLGPYSCTVVAATPIRLMAANSMPLPGGTRCTNLDLSFVQVVDGHILPESFICPAEFYEEKLK